MTFQLDASARASLLFACVFSLTLALLRPPFQLSDEVYYFATVQPVERHEGARSECQPLATPVMATGPERRLFRAAVSPILFAACQVTGHPAAALHMTRAVLAMGILIIVWATWRAGRMLSPATPEVAGLAAMMVASHPVLATMSAGVTPSALADPAAALACLGVVGATTAQGWHRFGWLAVGMVSAVIGLLAKDSVMSLTVLTITCGPLMVIRSARSAGRRAQGLLALRVLLAGLVATAALAVALTIVFTDGGPIQRFQDAMASARVAERVINPAVFTRTVRNVPEYYWSFIEVLGNFGGNRVNLPRAWGWIVLTLAIIGGLGLLVHPNARGRVDRGAWRRLSLFFFLALALLLLQAPVRDAMFGAEPAVQGRWLFPVILPLSIWTSLGLVSWVQRARQLVPLLVLVFVTVPVVALCWVILPHFYTVFPSAFNVAGLFLRGPHGSPVDPSLLAPFLSSPSWLADGRVGWALLVGTLASASWAVSTSFRPAEAER